MPPLADDAPRPPDRLRRLSESPWFWVVLFVNAALVGMWIIAPKYQQREGMLERRYEVRRDSALRRAAGQPLVEQSGAQADPHAQDRPLLVPLWRLTVLLVAIDVAAMAIFLWRGQRTAGSKPVEPSST